MNARTRPIPTSRGPSRGRRVVPCRTSLPPLLALHRCSSLDALSPCFRGCPPPHVRPSVAGRDYHSTLICLSKDRPSVEGHLPGVHSGSPRRGAFGNGLPPPLHVPSSRFCTTTTVFSSRPLHGCCTALPTVGFGASTSLRRPSHRPYPPFEAFPPPAAADRHRRAHAPRSPTGPTFTAFPRRRSPPPVVVADHRPKRPIREGSQGLAPPAGPLTTAAFPPRPSRCSHGLA